MNNDRETHLENCIEEFAALFWDIPFHIPGVYEKAIEIYNKAEIRSDQSIPTKEESDAKC